MSDLDKQLQEMAAKDWDKFIQITGDNFILTAKIRLLRLEGKSYKQIEVKLQATESQIRYACRDIPKKDDKN